MFRVVQKLLSALEPYWKGSVDDVLDKLPWFRPSQLDGQLGLLGTEASK